MTTNPVTPDLPDTQALQRLDAAHYLHPFTDHKALADKGARVMVRGDGIYLWDSEGRKMLDGMSGLWCVNVGYGRNSITQAVAKQMDTLPFYNSFFNTTNIPAIELAAKLSQLAPPGFQPCVLHGSGSEANDTNVRMVRRYWDLMGHPERQSSSAAATPTTAAPWRARRWAA
jgi:putrescine aminotransferase